jgi:hypothetical protein
VQRFAIVLGVLALLASGRLDAQETQRCSTGSGGDSGPGMKMDHGMAMRMDSMDLALDSLAKVMNTSTGTRKVNAMAGLLNAMLAHHREMRRSMQEGSMEGGEESGMPGMSGMGGGHEGRPCEKMATPGSDSTAKPDHHDH